jgi:hypothetical protein
VPLFIRVTVTPDGNDPDTRAAVDAVVEYISTPETIVALTFPTPVYPAAFARVRRFWLAAVDDILNAKVGKPPEIIPALATPITIRNSVPRRTRTS